MRKNQLCTLYGERVTIITPWESSSRVEFNGEDFNRIRYTADNKDLIPLRCECGNYLWAGQEADMQCEYCAYTDSQPTHKFHMSLFGTYWCDTCNSPYCELI